MRRDALVVVVLFSAASCTSTPHTQTRSPIVTQTSPASGFRLAEVADAAPAAKRPSTEVATVSAEAPDSTSDAVRNAAWQATSPPSAPAPTTETPPVPPPAPAPETETGAVPVKEPAPAGGAGLSLDAAISLALEANPSIGVANQAVRRSQGEWTQTGLYPNPIVGYMAGEVGQDDQIGQQGIFVQQTFPTGDKLDLNRAVSSGDVAAARSTAHAQRLRVQTDTRTRFYAALGAQKLVEIARRTEEYGRQGLDATRQLEEAGESSQADVLLAVTSYQKLRVERQKAEARAEAAWRQLAVMLGRPSMAPTPLVGELETPRRADDFELLWQRIRSTSPELQAASARVARARARIAREEATVIPDVNAQLSIQQDAATNHTIGGAQIGFMLPVHQQNQGGIAAARAEYCRQVKDYERLELALRDRLVTAVRDAEVAARQVTTYGESIVPAADEGLSLVRQGYEGGEFHVLRLVTAQQTYAEAVSGYLQAQVDLQQSLAVLDGVLLTGGLDRPTAPQGIGTPDSLTDVPKAQ